MITLINNQKWQKNAKKWQKNAKKVKKRAKTDQKQLYSTGLGFFCIIN